MAGKARHAEPHAGAVSLMEWWSRYIGLPFEDGGRGPHGYDCWGLVRAIYADRLDVNLPSYGEISARDLARIARAMAVGKDDGWRQVGVPRALDVALMRSGRGGARVVHVGVMVDGRRLLHIEEAAAAAVVPVSHFSVAGRIVGYRRLA